MLEVLVHCFQAFFKKILKNYLLLFFSFFKDAKRIVKQYILLLLLFF